MNVFSTLQQEITSYLGDSVEITEGVSFSQYKLIRRIYLFKNNVYPKGKVDKRGYYKYWFDIITPRMLTEVKNLDIDTKDILVFSENPKQDFAPVFISNMAMKEWLWDTGRAEEFNENVELFSGDGNVIFKRVKGGYVTCDPLNTYVSNITAKTVNDTAIIERAQLTQSDLRAKEGVWDDVAIQKVIDECGDKMFSATERTGSRPTTNPIYEVWTRTGEYSQKALYEAMGKEGGDEYKFVLGRVVCSGLEKGGTDKAHVLYAEEFPKGKTMEDFYMSAHRGPYKGRFWREGMYELLFDHQVRANEIGNQLARGLEWASKTVFRSKDVRTIQSLKTDLENGDIIRSEDIQQVEMRMQGLDQLIADWNRLMQDADRIANSFEVVSGESLPSGTPFKLGNLLDVNANKLFIFLRQKFAVTYKKVFKTWVLPTMVGELKGKDIIRVTGSQELLDEFYRVAAYNWYLENLVAIGPHDVETREALINEKIDELRTQDPMIENSKKVWDSVLPRLYITITGENNLTASKLESLANLVQYETDPARRAFVLDTIYETTGIQKPPPPPEPEPVQPGPAPVEEEALV